MSRGFCSQHPQLSLLKKDETALDLISCVGRLLQPASTTLPVKKKKEKKKKDETALVHRLHQSGRLICFSWGIRTALLIKIDDESIVLRFL